MRKQRITPYLFLLPSLIIVTLFVYYPLIRNIEYSLFDWNIFSIAREFIGFQNYQDLFQDPVFFTALKNNILYAIFSVVFQVGGGLVVAAILEDRIFSRFSKIFRTVYFIPVLISTTIIGLLFTFIYEPKGMLNQLLTSIGLEEFAIGWLGNSTTAIYAVIGVSQWQNIGYIMMLFVVAIQKISPTLYEAASLDGATKIQMFFKITVPAVKEMMIVCLVITLSGAFLVFNEIFILTSGGPGNASTVLGMHLYNEAFIHGNMGYASTIANVIFVLTLFLALIQMKLFKTGKE
jgi:raffinose/stachyose/melibiose transport system permease protein